MSRRNRKFAPNVDGLEKKVMLDAEVVLVGPGPDTWADGSYSSGDWGTTAPAPADSWDSDSYATGYWGGPEPVAPTSPL